jgi:uncharacterized protein YndB with AHSA1/START domain
MELTASEDIEAPQEQVFAALSDFDAVERQVMRRGIEITRLAEETGTGLAWQTKFTFRGKPRQAHISLVTSTAPERLKFHSVTGGLESDLTLDLIALSRNRTRITVTSVLMPKTLSARLLVQSLKLAKGGIDKRFRARMADLASGLETRLQGMSAPEA